MGGLMSVATCWQGLTSLRPGDARMYVLAPHGREAMDDQTGLWAPHLWQATRGVPSMWTGQLTRLQNWQIHGRIALSFY